MSLQCIRLTSPLNLIASSPTLPRLLRTIWCRVVCNIPVPPISDPSKDHHSIALHLVVSFGGCIGWLGLLLLHFSLWGDGSILLHLSQKIPSRSASILPLEQWQNRAHQCSQKSEPLLVHGWWLWWGGVVLRELYEAKSHHRAPSRRKIDLNPKFNKLMPTRDRHCASPTPRFWPNEDMATDTKVWWFHMTTGECWRSSSAEAISWLRSRVSWEKWCRVFCPI